MENKKEIRTERLLLRRLEEEDIQAIYELAKDPRVGPWAGWKPHESPEETERIAQTVFAPSDCFLITEKKAGTILGLTAIEKDRYRPDAASGEIGYWLGHAYWGHGYMTEAAEALIRYCFEEKGLAMVGICTSPLNKRSQRVIEKCGFHYEGTLRRTYKIYDGSLRDSRIYSMTKEEYEKRRLAAEKGEGDA